MQTYFAHAQMFVNFRNKLQRKRKGIFEGNAALNTEFAYLTDQYVVCPVQLTVREGDLCVWHSAKV